MNYYNYFTEIEDEFVKRRGSHILISPLDWSLIEAWRQLEIPLSIVLRGINSAFDGFDRLPKRGRKVNSLLFCQQEVEALYQQYRESQVGVNESSDHASTQEPVPDSQFGQAKVIAYLEDRLSTLKARQERYSATTALSEALGRAVARLEDILQELRSSAQPADQRLEGALVRIEQLILDGIEQTLPEVEKKQGLKEAQRQLKNYREGMGAEIYEQTLRNYLAKSRREKFDIPRLSLFYL